MKSPKFSIGDTVCYDNINSFTQPARKGNNKNTIIRYGGFVTEVRDLNGVESGFFSVREDGYDYFISHTEKDLRFYIINEKPFLMHYYESCLGTLKTLLTERI
jgi:hypothetical protein